MRFIFSCIIFSHNVNGYPSVQGDVVSGTPVSRSLKWQRPENFSNCMHANCGTDSNSVQDSNIPAVHTMASRCDVMMKTVISSSTLWSFCDLTLTCRYTVQFDTNVSYVGLYMYVLCTTSCLWLFLLFMFRLSYNVFTRICWFYFLMIDDLCVLSLNDYYLPHISINMHSVT